MSSISQAYAEGKEAYLEGKDRSYNPYNDIEMKFYWEEGFNYFPNLNSPPKVYSPSEIKADECVENMGEDR